MTIEDVVKKINSSVKIAEENEKMDSPLVTDWFRNQMVAYQQAAKRDVHLIEEDQDYSLRERLEAWRQQGIDYQASGHTGEMSIGPLWDMAMSSAGHEIIDGIDKLLAGKKAKE